MNLGVVKPFAGRNELKGFNILDIINDIINRVELINMSNIQTDENILFLNCS
jgi:hypothetical protein